jgi:hypothetical protein
MVSGIYRIGGIAALIADHDRYLLATFFYQGVCGFKFMRVLTRLAKHYRSEATPEPIKGKLIRGRHLAFPMAEVALCLRCLNRLSVVRVMNSRRICASPYAE